MSYSVLDLDLAVPSNASGLLVLEELRCERKGVFVLIRYAGRPVGKLFFDEVSDASLPVASQESLPVLLEAAGGRNLTRARVQAALDWSDAPPLPAAPKASVAVCTRERPQDLRRCLEALMRLRGDKHELLVIDNNPRTDATRAVAVDFAPQVRYLREDRPGLNAARNRALREAHNDIVAFNDDDAEPDADWLAFLVRNFDDPRVLCATGLVMPRELETESQLLFERHSPFGRGFKRTVFHGTAVDPLIAPKVGAGASMAVRRDLPALAGAFDDALDAGTVTRSGGDHEMFYRILSRGYSVVYDPHAVSWHRHRRTMEELTDTYFGYGVGVYAYWCRSLLREGEWRVLPTAIHWLLGYQLPGAVRAALGMGGKNTLPWSLARAELKGCAVGPWAYLRSCRRYSRKST